MDKIIVRFMFGVAALALLLMAGVVGAVVAGGNGAASAPTTLATLVSPAPPTTSAGPPREVEVVMTEFAFEPAVIQMSPGERLTLNLKNDGAIAHQLAIEGGPSSSQIGSGESGTLEIPSYLEAGSYRIICNIEGHVASGMVGTLVIGGPPPPTTVHAMTSEEMDASYMAGVTAFPAKTASLGGQPLEPQLVDGVKVFELTASVFDWEVAPGEIKEAWGYNGQVPGPEIRVQLGDQIRVIFHNQLPESSAIHFHGLLVPNPMDGVPGITQPLVKPGESFTYEFEVRNTGSHMYHSHMNAAAQIPKGLLGALIVEGADEPAVDHDITMILNDGPLGFTLNGKSFPATQPIVAKLGERIRIRYMNEGLQAHPMHLHGIPQQVYAKDGAVLPQSHQEDTVFVAPGERFDVIVEASEAGVWALHCHILNHAEREEGMFGMVTALVVQAA